MKSFTEHINETYKTSTFNERADRRDNVITEFTDISKAKALPLKYVMFFNDEQMRNRVQVVFTTAEDTFAVTKKGKMFNGETFNTKIANQAWNFAKLCNAWDDLSEKSISHLGPLVKSKDNAEKLWKEICIEFVHNMYADKLQITPKEGEVLEISKTLLTSKKFGI